MRRRKCVILGGQRKALTKQRGVSGGTMRLAPAVGCQIASFWTLAAEGKRVFFYLSGLSPLALLFG
ncbi:hypothetical protein DSM14862_03639 (plasmid) [Sulfitobacter indolifex]|nr:hypothetical protein DSM14862_03468 [Sulfitobacter indolifex]UOA20801.1 hypothetical protein DSM14862_03639 [Sulfitobacter indolifex]